MPKLDELKKLHPEDRLKRLKELEKERKEEIEEAKEMVKQSNEEIAEEDLIKRMNPPEAEEIQVEKLFRPREEPIESKVEPLKPEVEEEASLESELSGVPSLPPEQEIAQTAMYQVNQLEQDLRGQSTDSIYKSMSTMMEQPQDSMSQYQRNKIEAAYNIMKERDDLYGDSAGQKIQGSASKILSLHERIKQDYQS
jgi:hypothetical protein|tara:strand:- start:450 stop:1037 length:588 start_codon:yes stop_codon:yes gene_type:complete